MKFILVLLIFCYCFHSEAQTKTIDKLKRGILLSKSPDQKVAAIFQLCELGYTLHPDTLMYYAELAKKTAVKRGNKNEELWSMYYQSGALTTKGLVDSSLHLADKCLKLLLQNGNDPILEANLYNQKGRCYVRKNQYKEAIEMGYKAISLAEKSNNILMQVKAKTLIGWAYLEMDQLQNALSWHLKALHTTSDSVLLGKYAIIYANIATNYNGLGKTDSAFYYIKKGIDNSRKYENLFALSNSLAIQSNLYVRSGKAQLSEPILKEVIAIRKLIGDPFYIASDMSQLGLYYAHYGQPEKGIQICNEGLAMAKKYGLDTKLFFLYGTLAENYKALGNTQKYAEILENILALKDSVYQKNSAESLAEMQTKYDLQKKENLIIQQKLAIQQKNYLFYGSLILILFLAALGWFIFLEYKRRQQIKLEKMQAEEKILSIIAITKAEEQERKRIAADLHDNIGAYSSAIRADVEKLINTNQDKTNFTLNNLRQHSQEISNSLRDTIWVLNKENITIIDISDRIKNYLNKLHPSFEQIQFHITENIENNVRFSSQEALNIFRILQEALHNALKHSDAKNIYFEIISNKKINIEVKDDGKGIDFSVENKEGIGLINMKDRVKETGMLLKIESFPNIGTSISLFSNTN